MMTVSVVIAAYNESEHIARLLTSLRWQSEPPMEIIVVDDGSRDATARIAETGGARVLRTRHEGPASARNAGAAAATGDILVFIDGDMAAGYEYVADLAQPIRSGAVGSFSKEIYIGNPENSWARAYCTIRGLPLPRLLPDNFPNEWANFRAIRRDAFVNAGGYDDVGYGEDMTLAAKVGHLAVAARGATCWHFNPGTPREVFENGRWIGRGHDVHEVPRKWWDNSPLRALGLGIADALAARAVVPLVARLIYHCGVFIGLVEQRAGLHHAK